MKQKKKKIVHYITSLKWGGAEYILYQLVKSFLFEYHQTVLYVYDGPYRKKLEKLGINCVQVSGFLSTYDPFFWYQSYGLIKNISPNLIHTALWSSTIVGRIVGKLLSIPVISVYHGNVDQQGAIRNFFDRISFDLSQNCAVSSGVAQSLELISVQQKEVIIIENGIDMKVPVAISEKFNNKNLQIKDDRAFVVGCVGRLVAIKKIDVLIDAIINLQKKYNNIHLYIVGTGPELLSLQKKVITCGLDKNIHFFINVSAELYYSLFDCFVLPSDREGISIALLEALRAQLPVVVVDKNNNHPVITHKKNGLVLTDATAENFFKAIKMYYKKTVNVERIKQNGYIRLKNNFNLVSMVSRYKNIFEEIMQNSSDLRKS